ncbi:uncharacterized protein LOC125262826 isoform X1 [Megalobrama amblycephala]|uniref:uncharacterized protein LOC125262826 isoform X1 n=1 Tax=Megalobrama amblycephala TaxID=75352 RepID=UPI0020141E53|nr:uncharacterized protein LOC125262826 isoform X1 [Megalobrama amblycephala]
MVHAFVFFSLCLWHLVDVTDEMKTISVMEGDSVTLNTDVTEVQKYMLIQWMFGSTRIAEINRLTQSNSMYEDERFKDRLMLDQTGSLTITNTRTTDSGLYRVTVISKETSYMSFNVKVYGIENRPQATDREVKHHIHSCSFTEAVIRLVVSALVGVATVAVLVYDIRSTRIELNRMEETRHYNQTHGEQSDQQSEMSRRMSSRFV